MTFFLRQVGHFALWTVPVYLTVYACDSFNVSWPASGLIRLTVAAAWAWITWNAEWNELRDGKQTQAKFYIDRFVKIGAIAVSFGTAGWWREWI